MILNMFIRKLLRLLSLNIYLRSLVTIMYYVHVCIILFSVIDSVINPSVNTFPEPSISLCEQFCTFFTKKLLF